jgi:hypothetical protein
VDKGGKLIAKGTKDAPIVFTSGEATRTAGDFGGVILNGNAKVNLPGGSGSPEGIENGPTYGGNDDAESSGELSYVRIEFAGFLLSKDNELNALTMNAIGSGTKLDHVQVHFGTDDGFEWFGGTVSGKYLLATGIEDDCFDWDFGWRGKVQFLACVQDDFVKGDNGIEADNNASTTGAEPFSNPTVSNITLVGKSVAGAVGRGMLRLTSTAARRWPTPRTAASGSSTPSSPTPRTSPRATTRTRGPRGRRASRRATSWTSAPGPWTLPSGTRR